MKSCKAQGAPGRGSQTQKKTKCGHPRKMRFLNQTLVVKKGHLLAVLMAASELKLSHLQGNLIHLDSLPALLPRSTLLHYPLMPMLNMQGPLPKSLLRESFRKQIFFPSCDLISPKNMDFISVEILLLGKISFQCLVQCAVR